MRYCHLWTSFGYSSFLLLYYVTRLIAAEEYHITKTYLRKPVSLTKVNTEGFQRQEKQVNTVPLDALGTLSLDLSSIAMFGIMGLPILGALNLMVPLLSGGAKISKRKPASGKTFLHKTNPRLLRKKRDLPYAKDLLDLLISVESSLERYGITAPQCQLRATCEIHRRGINDINSKFVENFISLVSRMPLLALSPNLEAQVLLLVWIPPFNLSDMGGPASRKITAGYLSMSLGYISQPTTARRMRDEIQNSKVVPLAKYVFEYYEEAAVRGERNCDCERLYNRCPHSLDFFMKRRKGSRRFW